MDRIIAVSTWGALITGVVTLGFGVATLLRQKVFVIGRQHNGKSIEWRPFGWWQILLGTFIVVETVPRVTGASSWLVLVLSLFAFIPLACGIAALRRSTEI